MKPWQALLMANGGAAPAAAVAYRYWRMVIQESHGSPTGLQEVEFRLVAGGPTITTPTTPLLISSTNSPSLRPGARTVDRAASLYAWITPSTGPEWCAWDLLSPVTPAQFAFQPVDDVVARAPKVWYLQANNDSLSNTAPWVTIKSASNSPKTFAWQVIDL